MGFENITHCAFSFVLYWCVQITNNGIMSNTQAVPLISNLI